MVCNVASTHLSIEEAVGEADDKSLGGEKDCPHSLHGGAVRGEGGTGAEFLKVTVSRLCDHAKFF